jgi:peptide/nickel transport system substrate-binding protein
MKAWKKTAFVLLALLLAAGTVFAEGQKEQAEGQEGQEQIRLTPEETVVITGVEWGPPSNFNPFDTGGHVAAKYTLVYETLCHFDVFEGELTPWLATGWEWTSDEVLEMELREGVTFTDGESMSAEDVVFTFEVGKDIPTIEWHSMWEWTESVEAVDRYTVRFTFSEPHYAEINQYLYRVPIVPKHVWEGKSEEEITTTANENCISSGAYTYGKALDDRMIWERNEDWWGNEVFGKPAPKYIVLPVSYGNNVALGRAMTGDLDLANSYLPGLENIKDDYNLHTFYQDEPYHVAANVAVLYLNLQKEPMNRVKFRRALAYAIDPQLIVNNVYGGQVEAANPAGLLPVKSWMQYYDEEAAEEHGVTYDPQKARQLLEEMGMKDVNGDGFREDPEGKPMSFDIIVPSGWTDWMESIRMISVSAEKVGLKINPTFPAFNLYTDQLFGGEFDMAINNFNSTLAPSPYRYWNCVAYDELDTEQVTYGNFGRYRNEELFDAIDDFNMAQPGSTEAREAASTIQRILMQEMPNIPIWYNGMWAAMSPANWKGWPSEDNKTGIPCGWDHYWSMGGTEAILGLEPAEE